jgi:hypothetical protein
VPGRAGVGEALELLLACTRGGGRVHTCMHVWPVCLRGKRQVPWSGRASAKPSGCSVACTRDCMGRGCLSSGRAAGALVGRAS